jgi:NADH-quinone oxidoreductase subunit M
MFSHGVIGALLFAVAGRMIYRRTHTRDLDDLSLMDLNRALPFAAFVFVIASAASMGIPGFSGFAAEITILIGVWKTYPLAVWVTGAGMVLVAAFTLRALTQTFFAGSSSPLSARRTDSSCGELDVENMRPPAAKTSASPAERPIHLEPISIPEKLGAGLLIFATVAIGVYPKLLLDRIQPAVEAMRFLKTGG